MFHVAFIMYAFIHLESKEPENPQNAGAMSLSLEKGACPREMSRAPGKRAA